MGEFTYQRLFVLDGKQLAIPIIRKNKQDKEIPPKMILRLPTTPSTNQVMMELVIANANPISTIMPTWLELIPAMTRKYGPLDRKVAPVICDSPLQKRIIRVRRQLVPVKHSLKLLFLDSPASCSSCSNTRMISARTAEVFSSLLQILCNALCAFSFFFWRTR